MFKIMDHKLPFVGRSFKELSLFGKLSYIGYCIAAIVAGIAATWEVIGWFSHRLELSDKLTVWEVQSTLNIEKQLIKDDPKQNIRYAEIQKQLDELSKLSD